MRLCILGFVLVLSACSEGDGGSSEQVCDSETRSEEYVAGISKTGSNGYTVTILESDPTPIQRGMNAWTVQVSDGDGMVNDAVITTDPQMPDHGHGTSNVSVMTNNGDGTYVLDPVDTWMAGYWEIEVMLDDENDVELDTVMFKFCVDN